MRGESQLHENTPSAKRRPGDVKAIEKKEIAGLPPLRTISEGSLRLLAKASRTNGTHRPSGYTNRKSLTQKHRSRRGIHWASEHVGLRGLAQKSAGFGSQSRLTLPPIACHLGKFSRFDRKTALVVVLYAKARELRAGTAIALAAW